VQPDICVVCDREKLYDHRRLGAPDIIIEILSKGNSKKELKYKYKVYEESGVKEYYVVQPNSESVLIYTLTNWKYVLSRLLTHADIIVSAILPGFELDLSVLFKEMDWPFSSNLFLIFKKKA